MKLLQDEFNKRGFCYKLIQKSDSAFLYSISEGKELRGFEVFRKRISKASVLIYNGVEVIREEQETFPGNSDFGTWAWAYITLPFAMKKFESIGV